MGVSVSPSLCSASVFSGLSLFGADILSVSTARVANYSVATQQADSHFAANLTGLNFCNVSVVYTHPGQNDTINVQIWLPSNNWNGRFMGTGGGGFAAGYFDPSLAPAIARGYSAASTNAGHDMDALSPASWALLSPGNVNLYLLQDFATVSLNDMALIGKAVTQEYYGTGAKYSYWNGCSNGGRQGLAMAQRYPQQYNGILAAAPAVNWGSLIPSLYWPQAVMNAIQRYPRPCELDALTAAAIEACDANDGVVDNIISIPQLCRFDPQTMVGKPFSCAGNSSTISQEAATVAKAAWTGPRKGDGSFLWYGLTYDAPLSALAGTTCSSNGSCSASPFAIGSEWIRLFVLKDPSLNLSTITQQPFEDIFSSSNQQYDSIIGNRDADLSHFRKAGGKLLTWHGLADQLIPPQSTTEYYQRVASLDPDIGNFFRHFEAPGVHHCGDGVGAFPGNALDSLVSWVENGTAPTILEAVSIPVNGSSSGQNLCLYPLISMYTRGDPTLPSSYECVARRF
ncbi:Tannase/feruloyl esterase [Leptodontidium sp. 2 PMI_412]|nr:Tannase/feruloyl esterase [Leptodontidium sp. 2 PMI_412]